MSDELTQRRARELTHYDPISGVLTWRHRKDGPKGWNTRFSGKQIGSDHGDGYLVVRISGQSFLNHRFIWFYMFGYWPKEIDHEDQNKKNNKLANLRDVSRLENARNHTLQANNTSGHAGVYWDKQRGMWRAYVYVGKRQKHLGHFAEKRDAISARVAVNDDIGFHENHGRKKAA